MRVAVFGNSQSLPWDVRIPLEDTYPEQLARVAPELNVTNFSQDGDSIREFPLRYHAATNGQIFDWVVLQYGIVESSPRVLLKRERSAIQRVTPTSVQDHIRRWIHQRRATLIRRIGNRVELSSRDFFDHLYNAVQLVRRQDDLQSIICMEIPLVPPALDRDVSLGISQNISAYNEEIARVCRLFNLPMCLVTTVPSDTDYLSREAHFTAALAELYAQQLVTLITGVRLDHETAGARACVT